ncbi:MAG TPA: hypothetical protein GXZ90_10185 [Clostridiales bacterium]|nr:hypothetical protein [Clostridiales bacterium]
MAKFHINKHGVPAPCKAKPGNCPLGGDESHFNDREKAQAYIDKKNEAEYNLMPDVFKTADTIAKKEKKLTPAQKKAKEKAEFKEKLTKSLGKYWKNKDGTPNTSMVNHCLHKIKYITLGDSFVEVADSRPSISSEIFYDDETKAPEVNFESFYNYNTRFDMPKYYEMTGRNYNGTGTLKMIPQYDKVERFELAALTYDDDPGVDYIEINEDQLKEINKGVQEVIDHYDKRLKSYYKRHGDKIRAVGYWRNR